MASKTAVKKLTAEYKELQANPVKGITVAPMENNILEWHYVIEGPINTPYEGGHYWGKLVFPPSFPFAPPAVYMTTPSGRFEQSKRLCLTLSDYHPETWSPLWSISSILIGLVSFMVEEEHAVGCVSTSTEKRKQLAKASLQYNRSQPLFERLFPSIK